HCFENLEAGSAAAPHGNYENRALRQELAYIVHPSGDPAGRIFSGTTPHCGRWTSSDHPTGHIGNVPSQQRQDLAKIPLGCITIRRPVVGPSEHNLISAFG